MYIKAGKNRFVLILPKLGLALKFPVVHMIRAMQQFLTYGWQRPPLPEDIQKSLTEHLLKGIGDNWREFTFYMKTRHPFCQPTYFSLFGLMNVQRAGQPCGFTMQALWEEIHSITAGEAFQDAHHFSNPLNFCHDRNRQLKILDYGHPKTQEIIQKFGDSLHSCHHGTCQIKS